MIATNGGLCLACSGSGGRGVLFDGPLPFAVGFDKAPSAAGNGAVSDFVGSIIVILVLYA
jgi:hypothetical protein